MSQDDYAHLMKVLSQEFFASSQVFIAACQQNTQLTKVGKWEVPVAVQREVAETVSSVLSKFETYSQEMDQELGLGGGGDVDTS